MRSGRRAMVEYERRRTASCPVLSSFLRSAYLAGIIDLNGLAVRARSDYETIKSQLILHLKKQEEASAPAYYASSSASASSAESFPNIFATTGVSATVGGNLMGDAALCAA